MKIVFPTGFVWNTNYLCVIPFSKNVFFRFGWVFFLLSSVLWNQSLLLFNSEFAESIVFGSINHAITISKYSFFYQIKSRLHIWITRQSTNAMNSGNDQQGQVSQTKDKFRCFLAMIVVPKNDNMNCCFQLMTPTTGNWNVQSPFKWTRSTKRHTWIPFQPTWPGIS